MARKKSFDHLFDPLRRWRPKRRRNCDEPECKLPGEYRAPRSPSELDRYYWFCLDHVQAYNKAWNFYADMTPEEIERQIRFDTIWQRPTWPLGAISTERLEREPDRVEDPFDLFAAERAEARSRRFGREGHLPLRSADEQALAMLELQAPVTTTRLKARFKQLVKKLHPDANGGDKAAEEKLRLVIEAYATLKSSVRKSGPNAAI